MINLLEFISKEELPKMQDILDDSFPQMQTGPLDIEIEITEQCNARCLFFNHSRYNRRQRVMPFELFKKILLELKRHGLQTIRLSGGGEPTTHPDILKILDLINSLDLQIREFSTNGILLNEALCEKLKRCRFVKVVISLNSPIPKTWSQLNSRAEKDFFKVVHNIERLRQCGELGNVQINASLIINELTYLQLEDMIALCDRLAIQWHFKDLNTYTYSDWFLEKCVPTLIEKLFKISNRYNIRKLGFHNIPELVAFRQTMITKILKEECQKWRDLFCFSPWVSGQIRTDGDVHLCCHTFDGNAPFGNCFKEGFMPIWISDGYKKIRNENRRIISKKMKNSKVKHSNDTSVCFGREDICNCAAPMICPEILL